MNKPLIGIFFISILLAAFSSCTTPEGKTAARFLLECPGAALLEF